jgi:threonine dehydrogenase-like Zn-dependent dehydrogenase
MRKMRAARIVAPRRMEIDAVPLPEPGPSQVRVQLRGCGVCGSNLSVWQGKPWFQYPFEPGAPGHEGWGWVDQVGSAVKDFHPGDHVALLSEHAYAEYDIAEASHLIRVPENSQIFPGEALGCAENVFRRSEISSGQTVAVLGVGFLGALLIQLVARVGARALAISRRSFALEVARRSGAFETIQLTDSEAVIARIMERTAGRGCERVIEAAGEQATLDLASELVGVRGRLVIAGYHQETSRRVNMQLWNWRGIDVINAHERDPTQYTAGMRAAAEDVGRARLDPSFLYTHGYSLEEFPAAFAALEERPEGFLKAWISFVER